jgi:hypothetical protein
VKFDPLASVTTKEGDVMQFNRKVPAFRLNLTAALGTRLTAWDDTSKESISEHLVLCKTQFRDVVSCILKYLVELRILLKLHNT